MDVKFIEVSGTPYERGFQSGVFFKTALLKSADKYRKILINPDLNQKLKDVLHLTLDYCQDYVEEVRGKADGAGIPFEVYWAMMCPEILEETTHCTTIVMKRPNGSWILSHNEDDYYTEDNFCVTKVYTEKGWFVTNDPYNMPFGNGFSWNSHGMIKTINFCYEPDPDIVKIPRYFLQRHISEAASIADFIKRCRELPVASGFHGIVMDINLNQAVSVEVYPTGISVREIEDYYIHTNHYIHDKWKDNIQPGKDGNSLFRLQKASELMYDLVAGYEDKNEVTLKSLKTILTFRGNDNSFENSIWQSINDPYVTGVNFSVDSSRSNNLELYFYLSNEKLNIDYHSLAKTSAEKYFYENEKNWTYQRIINCSREEAEKLIWGQVDYHSMEKINELDTDHVETKAAFVKGIIFRKYPDMTRTSEVVDTTP